MSIDRERIDAVKFLLTQGYKYSIEERTWVKEEESDEDVDEDDDDMLYYDDDGERIPMKYSMMKSRIMAIRRQFNSTGSSRISDKRTVETIWKWVSDIEL